jgi:Rrf2 family protein
VLSKKTKYALKALIGLAEEHGREPVLIARLAEREGIPKKFLELILLELKGLGLVQSKMGKQGGYFLKVPPESVKLGHVVRSLDGPLAPIPCVSVTAYQRCEECRDEGKCGLRLVMKDVRDAIANILDNTTLQDVLDRVGEKEAAMFYI